jgi:hypothetical protein
MFDASQILGTDLLLLDDVAEPVFHLSPRCAKRKAAAHTLPVPAFRINGTRKGPLYVRKSDLEKMVEVTVTRAAALHRKIQAVL